MVEPWLGSGWVYCDLFIITGPAEQSHSSQPPQKCLEAFYEEIYSIVGSEKSI